MTRHAPWRHAATLTHNYTPVFGRKSELFVLRCFLISPGCSSLPGGGACFGLVHVQLLVTSHFRSDETLRFGKRPQNLDSSWDQPHQRGFNQTFMWHQVMINRRKRVIDSDSAHHPAHVDVKQLQLSTLSVCKIWRCFRYLRQRSVTLNSKNLKWKKQKRHVWSQVWSRNYIFT